MIVDFKSIQHDYYGKVESPTLVISTPDGRVISTISNYIDLQLTLRYNDVSEVSFTVPAINNGVVNHDYDKVLGMRLINVEPFGDFILVNPITKNDNGKEVKECKAYSLEYAFNYKRAEIPAGTYNFYNPIDNSDTILTMITEFMPDWSIGTVDRELIGRWRTFENVDDNLYSFMMTQLQESYNCLFLFDTKNKKIHVKSVNSEVPNLPIYLSYNNLVKSIDVTELSDDIVTALSGYGSGDDVNISSVNPNGTNTIYNLDYFIQRGDLPEELSNKWVSYRNAIETYSAIYSNLMVLYMQKINEYYLADAKCKVIETDLSAANTTYLTYQTGTPETLTAEDVAKYLNKDVEDVTEQEIIKVRQDYINERNAEVKRLLNIIEKHQLELDAQTSYADKLNEEVESINNQLNDISALCSIKKFFTASEYKTLTQYLKKDSITEDTFVVPEYSSAILDSHQNTLTSESNASVFIDGAEITATNITEIFGKNEDGTFEPYITDPDSGELLLAGVTEEIFQDITLPDQIAQTVATQLNDEARKVTYEFRGGKFNFKHTADKTVVDLENNVEKVEPTLIELVGDVVNVEVIYNKDNLTSYVDDSSPDITKAGFFIISATLRNAIYDGTEYPSMNISMQGMMSGDVPNVGKNNIRLYINSGVFYNTASTTEYQKQIVIQELYDYTKTSLEKLAWPSYEFTVDSANFIFAKEFEPFKDQLELGRTINLALDEDEENIIQPILIEVKLNYDNESDFGVTFSNKFHSSDSVFELADIIKDASFTSHSVSLNKANYAAYKESKAGNQVSNLTNNNLDVAKNAIVNSTNQGVEWNSSGMFLRKKTGPTAYDPEQVGLINNVIAFTDDNWESVKLALGHFTDENTGDSWGIVAPNITGTLLAGENLVIENTVTDDDGQTVIKQFKVDGSGAWLNNASFVLSQEPNADTGYAGGKIMIDPKYGIAAGNIDLFTQDGTNIIPSFKDEDGNMVWDESKVVETADGSQYYVPKNTQFLFDIQTGNAYFGGTISGENIVAGTINGVAIESLDASKLTGSVNTAQLTQNVTNAINSGNGTINGERIGELSADKITSGTISSDVISADTISGSVVEAIEISGDKISSNYLDVQNGYITNAMIGSLGADKITSGTISSDRINADSISGAVVDAIEISGQKISSDYLDVKDGYITNAMIDDLSADKITSGNISADRMQTNIIEAINAYAGNITADSALINTAVIGDLSSEYAHITDGIIDNANIDVAKVNNLDTKVATIADAQISNATITQAQVENLSSDFAHITNGLIDNADISHANVDGLNANYAHIVSGTIDNANIDVANVNNLNTKVAEIADAQIGNATISQAQVENLSSDYAHITNGAIDNAKIGHANVDGLSANYAQINFENVNNSWIENGVIKDAAITDAQIIGVGANKITAGTIDASKITVTNLNADNLTVGTINGERIGKDSISLDKLTEEVPTKEYVDNMRDTLQDEIDNAIETWTVDTVPTLNNEPASAWTTDEIKRTHVGDVCYVVNAENSANGYCYRFTLSDGVYSWVLIKDSDVTKALQDLLTAQGDIAGLKTFESQTSSWITNTNEELSSVKTRTTSLETDMGTKVDTQTFSQLEQTVDGFSETITQLAETVEAKADSEIVTTLSNTVNAIESTANSNKSSISTLTTTISGLDEKIAANTTAIEQTDQKIELKASQTDVDSLTGRVEQAESSITAQAGQIESKVSKDGIISSINQSAESITINAGKINLNGAVTFDSFDSTLQTTINNKATSSDVNNAVSEIKNDLSSNSGQTQIDGAHIITGTLNANKITANSITSSQLATDAIKSKNYLASTNTSSPYSALGTFLDLQNGNLYTPNFGVNSVTGAAYLNGTIYASDGKIGDYDNSANYWAIGSTEDSNNDDLAYLKSVGKAYIQTGNWQLSNDSLNTQSYSATTNAITYPTTGTNYYDYGMHAPGFETYSGNFGTLNDSFLYIRKSKSNAIPTIDADWNYLFRVDRDGKLSVSGLSVNGVDIATMISNGVEGGAYVPTSGGSITGNLSVSGTITGTLSGNASSATKATQDGNGNTITSTYHKLSGSNTNTATNTFSGANTFSASGGFNFSGIELGTSDASRPVWFSWSGKNGTPVYDNDFLYNPATNTLTVGSITGTAAKATADASGNVITSTYAPINNATFTGVTTIPSLNTDDITAGNLLVNGAARFTNGLSGTLTGNVIGNVSGNAGSATKLATPRNITIGNSTKTFDGSSDITFDTDNFNIHYNNIKPLKTKTYTGVYSEQDNDTYGYKYYASIKPTSYKALWHIKLKITAYVPNQPDYYGSYIFDCSGMRNTYSAYACWNNIQSDSYRPFYHHSMRFASDEAKTNSYGHLLGVYLRSCANYTNSNYARTYKIEVLEEDNCTFSFFDNYTIYGSVVGTGNFNGNQNFNAANYGLQESGDNDNYAITQYTHQTTTVGSELNLPYLGLFGLDRDGKSLAFSNYQADYTSYTASINVNRVYSTLGMDYTRGMYVHTGSSYYAKNSTVYNGCHWRVVYSGLDFRYSDNNVSTAGTTLSLVSYKPVYVRGIIKEDGLFYIRPMSIAYDNKTYRKYWTQDIPTEVQTDEDGYQYMYWFIGYPYYSYSYYINLQNEHPMYWFHNGRFEEYNPHSESADRANITTTVNAIAKYSDVDGSFADTNATIDDNGNVQFMGNVTIGKTASDSTVAGVGNFKIGAKNDQYGLMPYANNWNSIGLSGLAWYRAFVTNYYGTTSYIENWRSGNNIGTAVNANNNAILGNVNFYNNAVAGATQTKTNLTANTSTNTNITVTLPSSTGTLALTSDNVASATKLTSDAGSATQPIYFSDGKPVATTNALGANIVGYLGSLKTNGWNILGGKRSSGASIAVAYNNDEADWNSGKYSSSLVFGSGDTKGLLDLGYNAAKVTFGGGWAAGSTDDNPYWYFKLHGTNGKTYTLPSDTATLAANDGSNATGSWGISVTGSAAKLSNTVAIGSASNPVYFSANGVPVASDYTFTTTTPSSGLQSTDRTVPTSYAVWDAIQTGISANAAMVFKGTIGSSGATITSLPANHTKGDTYIVSTSGTYAGVACTPGDMVICVTTGTTATNSHWTVVHTNTGAVTGPASSTANHIATFSDSSGGAIKDSGYTIATSVPANAVFTDTNKYHKTGSWSGLTYTAEAVGGADALAFTIPTGNTANTVAPGNHTHNYLSLDGGTVTGSVTMNTQANTTPFYISRNTGHTEAVAHGVDDNSYNIVYTNDEATSQLKLRFVNTDTESGGGANASDNTYVFTYDGNFYPQVNNRGSIGTSSNKWANVYATTFTGALNGNADTATKATQDASGNVITSTYAVKNNPTFTGVVTAPTLLSDDITTGNLIVNGSARFTNGLIGDITGNASSATKLATARTITLSGSVTGSTTFDGSGNVTISTTTNHTHSYLPLSGGTMSGDINFDGSQSLHWNSNTYRQRIAITDDDVVDTAVFRFQQSTNGGSSYTDLMTIKDNGKIVATTFVGALSGNASTATTATTANALAGFSKSSTITWGSLSNSAYSYINRLDTANGGSVAFADKDGQTSMQIDGTFYQNEGQYKVLDTSDIYNGLDSTSTTKALSANQGYLLKTGGARDDTKLPLAGGTMTGTTILPENKLGLHFRNNSSYHSGLMYQTSGNEALVFANKQAITSYMFLNGVDPTTMTNGTWTTATPAMQIKNNSVYINKLIPNGTTPTHKLYVNGDVQLNGKVGIAEAVTLEYNATNKCLNFVFS